MHKQLLFLAALISPYEDGCPDTARVAAINWHYLAFLSGCYLVTPSLAFRVAQCNLMEQIPQEVADELREIAANASRRNERLRAQLAEIAAAFEAATLRHAVLKGGTYLVLPVYPATSLRVMRDIDLLVAEQDLDHACRVLEGMAYHQVENETPDQGPAAHRHLNPFVADRHVAVVELHRAALPGHLGVRTPSSELLRKRSCRREDGQTYYTLSTTDRILILIMHAAIVDCGHAHGIIALRALEEYAYTVKKEGDAIRWPLLVEKFSDAGRLHVLSSFVWLANHLFGVPTPRPLLRGSALRSELHYLRCLLQFESCIADRWLRYCSRYSGSSSLDHLGTRRGLRARGKQRLHAVRRVLRRSC
jgi:hypothetical protein